MDVERGVFPNEETIVSAEREEYGKQNLVDCLRLENLRENVKLLRDDILESPLVHAAEYDLGVFLGVRLSVCLRKGSEHLTKDLKSGFSGLYGVPGSQFEVIGLDEFDELLLVERGYEFDEGAEDFGELHLGDFCRLQVQFLDSPHETFNVGPLFDGVELENGGEMREVGLEDAFLGGELEFLDQGGHLEVGLNELEEVGVVVEDVRQLLEMFLGKGEESGADDGEGVFFDESVFVL